MDENLTPLDSFPPDKAKGNTIVRKWMSTLLLVLAGLLILGGTLFKIMHWPFSGVFLVSGLAVGAIWFVKDLFKK